MIKKAHTRWALFGAVVIAAIIAGAVVLRSGGAPSDCSDDELCYYVEVQKTTRLPGGPVHEGLIKTWYGSDRGWRQEEWRKGADGKLVLDLVTVSRDDTVIEYFAESNSYTIKSASDPFSGYAGPPSGGSIRPLGSGSIEEYFASFPNAGSTWERVDEDEILGHRVEVIRVINPPLRGQTSEGRLWIDTERMFGLKESWSGASLIETTHEAAEIDYTPRFNDKTFEFEPPPGARQEP